MSRNTYQFAKQTSLTMGLITVFLVIYMVNLGSCSRTLQQVNSNVFDVLQFGAVGDGSHDDSKAFLAAWKAACGAQTSTVTLTIPKGRTYLLSPLIFQGPCKSSVVNVQVIGKLACVDIHSWPVKTSLKWIVFSEINGLLVNGQGTFDGRGSYWWAKYKDYPQLRPTALTFEGCDNLRLRSITHINSARNHISLHDCHGVIISNLEIDAPEDSPNTDGIDIYQTTGVTIYSCIIATGDDCIAINGQTANVNITDVACGPGHGISIGSLGANGATETVEQIHVTHSSFYRTMYGARIKTWQGGKGYARHISFEDITLIEAKNAIVINQFYCDSHSSSSCKAQREAVRISDVKFDGFHGTLAGGDAVQLRCSDTYGCSGIVLSNLNITSVNPGKDVSTSCVNAHGQTSKIIHPKLVNCLLP